jgi:hypothetical protein
VPDTDPLHHMGHHTDVLSAGVEHWATGQLEFIDSQLSNYAHNRARHRQDVVLYARVGAHLPMRYHQTQVAQCTARIEALLDLRLQAMAHAQQGSVQ